MGRWIRSPRRAVAESNHVQLRARSSKQSGAYFFSLARPCPCKLLEFGTAQNLYGSKSRAARGHPSDAGRARELDGMAAVLARRAAVVLARRGRGMCSASATALSSEELIRMERDCSAHKYVSSPLLPYPVSLLPPSVPPARAPHARWNAYVPPALTRSCYRIS